MKRLIFATLMVGCIDNPVVPPLPQQPIEDATTDARPDASTELQPRPVTGRWFAGDFHVHATGASNDTGGDSTPTRIKEVAIERGLDLVVLTDHSNSTGSDVTTSEEDPALFNMGPEFPLWDEVATLSDETFLMIDGNEMSPIDDDNSSPTGHIGCYPIDLETFDPTVAFTDRPRGTVNSASTIEQARAAGCFVTMNHPFGPAPWISFDWTSYDYDAMEVFNGSVGWDDLDRDAMKAWACDRSVGRRVTAVGGSDNHRVNIVPPGSTFDPPLAWPTTWVFAEKLDWNLIIAQMQKGAVTVGDISSPLEFDAHEENGTWLAMPGDVISPGTVRFNASGTLDRSDDEERLLQIIKISPGACDDTREEGRILVPEPNWTVVSETAITPGPFAVEVTVDVTSGESYFAWLVPDGGRRADRHGVALTNDISVR